MLTMRCAAHAACVRRLERVLASFSRSRMLKTRMETFVDMVWFENFGQRSAGISFDRTAGCNGLGLREMSRSAFLENRTFVKNEGLEEERLDLMHCLLNYFN